MSVHHRFVDLDGPVHYADFGGDGQPLVLVHGLGGSLLNWLPVANALTTHGRVVALDLAGHGRTPSLGRARVGANRRLLGRFLEAVAGAPAVLVGNSMGGYLSLAEAAAEPAKVTALVLVDAAVPLASGGRLDRSIFTLFAALALPGLGEAFMRLRARRGPERMVRDVLRLCGVQPDRIAPEVLDAHVALALERATLGAVANRDFLAAQRSLMNRLVRRRQFFEMIAAIRAPALIVQGERDRLVRLAAARVLAAARPDWRLEVLAGVGHVPMIEAPERFLGVVGPWLEAQRQARGDPRAS
jgi:pimeloyl-ACP methyl ester carboxylesterase